MQFQQMGEMTSVVVLIVLFVMFLLVSGQISKVEVSHEWTTASEVADAGRRDFLASVHRLEAKKVWNSATYGPIDRKRPTSWIVLYFAYAPPVYGIFSIQGLKNEVKDVASSQALDG